MATKSTPAQKPKAAGPATRGLRVASKYDNFRRAGHVFGQEAKTVPLSELSDADVAAIKADKALIWVEVDIEPEAAADAPK